MKRATLILFGCLLVIAMCEPIPEAEVEPEPESEPEPEPEAEAEAAPEAEPQTEPEPNNGACDLFSIANVCIIIFLQSAFNSMLRF